MKDLIFSLLGSRLATGMFWSLLGSAMFLVTRIVSYIFIGRLLGKQAFGQIAIIQSTIDTFAVVIGFGMGITAAKFISEYRATEPDRAGRVWALCSISVLIMALFGALLLNLVSPWLSSRILALPQINEMLRISSLLLFFSTIAGTQSGVLVGFEKFRGIFVSNLWSAVVSFLFIALGIYYGGLKGVVIAMVCGSAFTVALNHAIIRKESIALGVRWLPMSCWLEKGVLWKYSIPAILASAMFNPVIWIANTLLVNQSDGYSQMGIYNAALRIKQIPEMVLGILLAPLLPIWSERFSKGAIHGHKNNLLFVFALSMAIMIPISMLQMAMPDLVISLFGKEFKGSYLVVQWLMFYAILSGLFYPYGTIITSLNKMWLAFGYNFLSGICFLIAVFLLVPKYGAIGLACATTLSYVFSALAWLWYLDKYEGALVIKELRLRSLFFKMILMVSLLFWLSQTRTGIALRMLVLFLNLAYIVFVIKNLLGNKTIANNNN